MKIKSDPDYGELITIDNLPDLFLAIAFRLATKPHQLTGEEMRFLRKRMELTQVDLAKELWVSEQTVANYEKNKTNSGPADRALQFLFLAHIVDDEDLAEELRLEAEDLMRPSRRDRSVPIGVGRWTFAASGQ